MPIVRSRFGDVYVEDWDEIREKKGNVWNEKDFGGVRVWHPELVNIYDSEIGEGTIIAALVEIGVSKIGKRCAIGAFAFIPQGTVIGNDVFIAPAVRFANDKYPRTGSEWTMKAVVVENNVSIGMGALIMPNVIVGHHSFIAAGSLVTKNVPPRSFAEGSPAKCFELEVFKKMKMFEQ